MGRGECDRGVVFGGSGNGEAIVANKLRGVRCALIWNEETARLCREHNDANVISIGPARSEIDLMRKMVDIWLETPFEGDRHERRLTKISLLEETNSTTRAH